MNIYQILYCASDLLNQLVDNLQMNKQWELLTETYFKNNNVFKIT